MSISPAFLDEIRARVTLSGVVGRKVKLIRAGREFKACCPFHNEKTPSFTVNDDKGFYHCFGCGAHGDVLRFVMEQDGLPFREAVEKLAGEAGLEMPVESRAAREEAQKLKSLHDVMAAAEAWFVAQYQGIGGADARAYVAGRGLSAETVQRFRIGFAPDSRSALKSALKDVEPEKLISTGLLIAPEGGGTPYDRFRGRLMFPIRDPRGRTIAFGGRILGQGEPKYLNSPDTPLFDKGHTLYNLDRAGPLARKSGRIIVVEGYMDVIALDQAGIGEAVAPLGTALTEAQIGLLWRVADEPLLCFDGDAAGTRAALRAALRALPLLQPGKSLNFLALPAGQDPDDIVRTGGAAAFEALAARPEPLVERLWRAELEAAPSDTPEQRAGLMRRLREHAKAIRDPEVAGLYDRAFRERFDERFRARQTYRQPYQGRTPMRPAVAAVRPRPAGDTTLAAVLTALLERPALISGLAEMLAEIPTRDASLGRLRGALLDFAMTAQNLDKAGLDHNLAQAGLTLLADEVRRSNRLAFSFTRRDTGDETAHRDMRAVLEALVERNFVGSALKEAAVRYQAAMNAEDVGEDRLNLLKEEHDRLREANVAIEIRLKALSRSNEQTNPA